jgi:DNA invertase Pin-like site-specific DNA recombinase
MTKSTLTNSTIQESPTKRAFIYLRVSSEGQVQTDYDPDGLSISAQREAGNDKAAQLDAEVTAEFSDPGKSAYVDLHKRTGFLAMLDELKQRNEHAATRVDFVIVWSLSRWARNTVDHWQTRELVHKTGARLISITEPMAGEDTASGFLYEGMVVTYNQYQSMLTGEGVKRGLLKKAQNGGTYGWARLGYLNAVDELPDGRKVASVVPDPDRDHFITAAFQLYASGEYSVSQLAGELDRLGLRTRRTRRHSGGKVGTTSLQRMLRDPYYAGWIVYKRGTSDEQVFPGRHQPLIDQDTFDLVQSRLEEKRVAGERPQHRKHYLRGSVFCGECGQRLTFAISTGKNGHKYPYFFCMSRINGGKCPMRANIRPELIEAAIARYYQDRPVELSAEDVRQRTEAIEGLVGVSQEAVAQVRDAKTALIAKLKAQQLRLIRLHAEEGDSVSPDAFRDERTRLKAEIDAAEESLAETEQRMVLDAEQLRMALRLAENVVEVYAVADEQTKRGYNQAFFKKLYVLPEWDDEQGREVVRISGAELTEPYAVLLADDLVPGVLAEAEAITAGSTSSEDDPEGPSSAVVSYFELLAGRVGFEPTSALRRQQFSRGLLNSPGRACPSRYPLIPAPRAIDSAIGGPQPAISQLGWRHHKPKPLGAASQPTIERHQATAENLRQRDVLGVIGPRVPKLIGDAPGSAPQAFGLSAAHRCGLEPAQQQVGSVRADLFSPLSLVGEGEELRPHQWWRDQFGLAQVGKAFRLRARRHCDVRVKDEHQWPRRDSFSNATQLGTGVPSSKVFQASGSPTISSSPSDSSTTTIRAFGTCGAGRASTSRCSCSRVAMHSMVPARGSARSF